MLQARLNDGLGIFGTPVDLAVPGYPEKIVAGDVDGDGDNDVVVVHSVTSSVFIAANDGAGSLTEAETIVTEDQLSSILLANYDMDGDLDLRASRRR